MNSASSSSKERFAAYLAQTAAQADPAERLGQCGKPVLRRKGRRPKFSPWPREGDKRTMPWRHESGIRYVFHHQGDPNREFILTVLAFHVPS